MFTQFYIKTTVNCPKCKLSIKSARISRACVCFCILFTQICVSRRSFSQSYISFFDVLLPSLPPQHTYLWDPSSLEAHIPMLRISMFPSPGTPPRSLRSNARASPWVGWLRHSQGFCGPLSSGQPSPCLRHRAPWLRYVAWLRQLLRSSFGGRYGPFGPVACHSFTALARIVRAHTSPFLSS